MKNKHDAVKALTAAGWTPTEIKAILGNLPELHTPPQSNTDTPWWTYVGEDRYADGTPLVEDWFTWIERGKPI